MCPPPRVRLLCQVGGDDEHLRPGRSQLLRQCVQPRAPAGDEGNFRAGQCQGARRGVADTG
jgi:hypothetical protein